MIFNCFLCCWTIEKANTYTASNFTEVPTITYPTAENASYNEGSHVNITCAATGKPDPEVKWTHKGQVKSSGQNTTYLSFCKTDKKDAGIYTCIANNSAGRIAKQLKLEVNCECVVT